MLNNNGYYDVETTDIRDVVDCMIDNLSKRGAWVQGKYGYEDSLEGEHCLIGQAHACCSVRFKNMPDLGYPEQDQANIDTQEQVDNYLEDVLNELIEKGQIGYKTRDGEECRAIVKWNDRAGTRKKDILFFLAQAKTRLDKELAYADVSN